jgi:hypothetical protein
VNTADLAGQRAEVSVAVRAQNPQQRSFCWAASTRLVQKAKP